MITGHWNIVLLGLNIQYIYLYVINMVDSIAFYWYLVRKRTFKVIKVKICTHESERKRELL
jgi:hypothetical protein